MKKWKTDETTIETKVERFLFSYRNTPHSSTGVTPAERLMNRKPRTILSALKPDRQQGLRKEANTIMKGREKRKLRTFIVGDKVLARNYSTGDTRRNRGNHWSSVLQSAYSGRPTDKANRPTAGL